MRKAIQCFFVGFCVLGLLMLSVSTSSQVLKPQFERSGLHVDSLAHKVKALYAMGLRYKNGLNTAIDYKKAFECFKAAAALGDPQSIYAVAYFYYKGFVHQDYTKAATLFRKGAYSGRANSQYFLGLIYLNGYGVPASKDSGRYWLQAAAEQGYQQAQEELKLPRPEHNDSAEALLSKIEKASVPAKISLNQYVKVNPAIPDTIEVEGTYEGYIVTYDWSGAHVVNARKLRLNLSKTDRGGDVPNRISGYWQQSEETPSRINATFEGGHLSFDSSYYSRTDHYSLGRPIRYDLTSASLHIIQAADSTFLTGNVKMFSPQRNEPSKPTVIALVRTSGAAADERSDQQYLQGAAKDTDSLNEEKNTAFVHLLKVYPNPFSSILNLRFKVIKTAHVSVRLYTIGGKLIYQKKPELLTAAAYTLQIPAANTLQGQTYILQLQADNKTESIKVIRK